jgi:hypothetical protein
MKFRLLDPLLDPLLEPLSSCILISPAGRMYERVPCIARLPVPPHGTGCLTVPAMTPITPRSGGRFTARRPLRHEIGAAVSYSRPAMRYPVLDSAAILSI